tara:strand:- start:780 stop:980 length:201 start_codon:yes stop_codon:yes gene_type:complete
MAHRVGETVYYTKWNEAVGTGSIGVITSITPDGIIVKLATETNLEADFITAQEFELNYPDGNAYND